jgi:hypothetical protein
MSSRPASKDAKTLPSMLFAACIRQVASKKAINFIIKMHITTPVFFNMLLGHAFSGQVHQFCTAIL